MALNSGLAATAAIKKELRIFVIFHLENISNEVKTKKNNCNDLTNADSQDYECTAGVAVYLKKLSSSNRLCLLTFYIPLIYRNYRYFSIEFILNWTVFVWCSITVRLNSKCLVNFCKIYFNHDVDSILTIGTILDAWDEIFKKFQRLYQLNSLLVLSLR